MNIRSVSFVHLCLLIKFKSTAYKHLLSSNKELTGGVVDTAGGLLNML